MNNLTLVTSYSECLSKSILLGEKIIFQSPDVILLMNGSFKGKYVYDETPECFITIIGSAFYREEFSINRAAVSSKSDLQRIWNLFKEKNYCGNILSGFFNIIFFDKIKKKTSIISSHFGIRPIFYSVFKNSLVISTSPNGIIKTNLIKPTINKSSVLQFLAFNYTINEDTFYQKVSSLEAGSSLVFQNSELEVKRYFDSGELIKKPLFSYKDSKKIIFNELKEILNKYQKSVQGFSISLTGGWDGRLILALLKDNNKISNTYSHGKEDDGDVLIPVAISKRTNVVHKPYIINASFYENEFVNFAKQTIENTSGMRSIARSHYLYSVGNELKINQNVITGICGSNLMKGGAMSIGPVWNNQINILIFEPDFEKVKKHLLGFLNSKIFEIIDVNNDDIDVFLSIVEKIHNEYHKDGEIAKRVYRFLLNIVERKYFGNEILSYAHLGENFAPFIDIEFVEMLCKTPYFGAYMKMSGGNIFVNWRNSLLYAYMINLSNPLLGKIVSDKGVSLYDLSKVYRWPWVIKQQYLKRSRPKLASKYDVESGINYLLIQDGKNSILKSKENNIKSIDNKELKYNVISYLLWLETI